LINYQVRNTIALIELTHIIALI